MFWYNQRYHSFPCNTEKRENFHHAFKQKSVSGTKQTDTFIHPLIKHI